MKKIVSVLLLVCIMVSMCSLNAFAEEKCYPKATVRELDVNNLAGFTAPDVYPGSKLTCAYSYSVDAEYLMEHEAEMMEFIDWIADFELTITGMSSDSVVFNADELADGYLSGHYKFNNGSDWYDIWFNVPTFVGGKSIEVKNNGTLKIMEKAKDLLIASGSSGLAQEFNVTCAMVAEMGTFDCGIYFTPEFLAKNPDMKLSLSLKIKSPHDSQEHTVSTVVIDPTPAPPAPPVPATADNSNMPLWTALFIAFAAVVLLTGKKKKA